MTLLGNRYAPITDSMGFLEADLSKVVAADQHWRASLGGYTGHTMRGTLPALLDALLPLTGPLLRYIWVQSSERWTAYVDNFILGSDAFGPISYLSQQLGCCGSTIGCRAGTSKRGAAVQLSLFGPKLTDFLNHVRSVSAVQDEGRWQWAVTGSVQPFEEVEKYQQRRISDRLTPDMLARYCEALGISPFDESFYGADGYIVENSNVRGPVRTEGLHQARLWHGLA